MNQAGPQIVTGCCQIPKQTSFKEYFSELGALETTLMANGSPKHKTLKTWRSTVPEHVDFSINTPAMNFSKERSFAKSNELDNLVESARILNATSLVFSNTNDFSTSASNRAALSEFFGDIKSKFPDDMSVFWFPKGLWSISTALDVLKELPVFIGFDPLANDALNENSPLLLDLFQQESIYLKVEQTGHKRRRFDSNELEALAMTLNAAKKAWVYFDNQGAFADAKIFNRMISTLS